MSAGALLRRRRPKLGSKRQKKFLLVVRLILKSLEQSGNSADRLLAARIKTTVREFTLQNRSGIKGFIPLQDKLEITLRNIVGDDTFVEASFLVDFYFAKQRLQAFS